MANPVRLFCLGDRRVDPGVVQSGFCEPAAEQIQKRHAIQWILRRLSRPSAAANEMFSLRVPIQFDSNAPIAANHPSPRQGAMFKVPAQGVNVSVVHETTGDA